MTSQEDQITSGDGTLWGSANGQLEFCGMQFVTEKTKHNGWQKFVILRFTDHDLQAVDLEGLQDAGLKPFYELKFPIAT